ncbi:MAG: Sensor kinase CckA [Arcobacter lacus]|nr:MAG: Sensor kinase CckA [Arcobacter lacus]
MLVERNIKSKKIYISTYCDEKYATLTINDNSGGIKEDIIDKIFDPYFSTKKNQEGTGLGLYMSKTIINEHCNGKLYVNNNELGAIFTIKLNIDTAQ